MQTSVEGAVHTAKITVDGKNYEVNSQKAWIIGRALDSDIVLSHELVSRRHACLEWLVTSEGEGWYFRDLGSANGIYFNGTQVAAVLVIGNALVRLGDAASGPEVLVETYLPPVQAEPQYAGTVIGKGSQCDFIVRDVLVSRVHAQLVRHENSLWLEDLGSLNGTFVNGQLIAVAPVVEGDVITVGNTDLTIREGQLDFLRLVSDPAGGLVVEDLEFEIKGGKKLLRGVNLDARSGTLTAIIGPSGAGKSTLCKVLAGVTSPTHGSVSFDDFDIHKSFDLMRSRIGLVPQDDVLHTSLKLEEALRYAARLRLLLGKDENELNEQVNRVITQLELDQQRGTRIDKLSGGQRKRASVSLELLTEPALLILDEPTSGLGPDLDRQVMLTLRELADGNRTVMVITHSVAQLSLCDQVLVLAPGGMPAYYGPPQNILSFFGTDNWADIFASLAEDPEKSYQNYQAKSPAKPAKPATVADQVKVLPTTRSPKWWDQFITLCRRQTKLIFADGGYLTFLLALPIVVGLLVKVVPGENGLGPASSKDPGEPSQLLAMLIIGASFMGASISIRDLVGERAIYLRERAVGLPVSAYLASKLVIFGIFAWLMAGLLTLVTFSIPGISRSGPTQSVLFPDQKLELFIALGLTAMASMVLGLLLSSLVRSSEQAMPLLIIVLMAQLVLNGGLLPLYERPFFYEFSSVALAKWGFAMGASGADLMNLTPSMSQDPLWEHNVGIWILSAAVLVSLTAVLATATRIRLEGKYLR